MQQVQLSAGTIEYQDTGGSGPVLVFIHGLTMDGSVWRQVVEELRGEYRCILPTWPLGGHRVPMNPDADLTLIGLANLISEFLERLDLRAVTLIQNDWGGAQILIGTGDTERVGRLVLTSCEAFDNYPPLPARMVVASARIPGGLRAVMAVLGTRLGRRGPGAWGWMSKRPVPTAVMDEWFRPATTDRLIRRDMRKYVTSVPKRARLLEIAERAADFDKPVLIAWATEDRMMPIAHGRRLAQLFPDARLAEIADSYTLIPEDQPEQLSKIIGDFLGDTRA